MLGKNAQATCKRQTMRVGGDGEGGGAGAGAGKGEARERLLANCSTRKIKRIRPGHGQEVRTSCPAPPRLRHWQRLFKPARSTIVLVALFLIFIDLCKTDRAGDTALARFFLPCLSLFCAFS